MSSLAQDIEYLSLAVSRSARQLSQKAVRVLGSQTCPNSRKLLFLMMYSRDTSFCISLELSGKKSHNYRESVLKKIYYLYGEPGKFITSMVNQESKML